jgi:transposase
LSTKVHLICDSHGNPIDFVLTGGQTHDCTQSCTLLLGKTAVAVLADKGYDDNRTRSTIQEMGAEVVIPSRSCRKEAIDHDAYLYRARHAVENVFAKMKHFRSLATRYDKLTRNYAARVAIACMVIWLRL